MLLTTSQYPDCLVVLDTLGVRSDATILGIAAARFNIDDNHVLPQFLDLYIDPDSNTRVGRVVEAAALQWWAERPDYAEVFGRSGQQLHTALEQLYDFFADSENLWTTAGGYEVAMLTDAFHRFNMHTPWPYWGIVCGRTLCNLAAWLGHDQVQPTVYGSRLSDTLRLRLDAVRAAYAQLKRRKDASARHA